MRKRALTRWSKDELETAILSGSLDNIQRYEAERVLRERELNDYGVSVRAGYFVVGMQSRTYHGQSHVRPNAPQCVSTLS